MKVITVNFLTCAVKACRASPASTPLHFKDAELEQQELDFNPSLIRNILPRIDWDSLRITAQEVSPCSFPGTFLVYLQKPLSLLYHLASKSRN
jgi:multifunctional methyltransferase subunit TRM112